MPDSTITDDDLARIDLAAQPFKYAALRERHAAERFGDTPVRFWQRVNAMLDHPDVLAARPMQVRQLRRLRERRRVQRDGSFLG